MGGRMAYSSVAHGGRRNGSRRNGNTRRLRVIWRWFGTNPLPPPGNPIWGLKIPGQAVEISLFGKCMGIFDALHIASFGFADIPLILQAPPLSNSPVR